MVYIVVCVCVRVRACAFTVKESSPWDIVSHLRAFMLVAQKWKELGHNCFEE